MTTERLLSAVVVALAAALSACGTPPAATPSTPAVPAAPTPAVSETYGIEFLDTRLSAADSVVDLRYRVIDAGKAQPLLDRKLRPVLVNAANGHRYYVPTAPIVGALRQTTRATQPVQVGRTYFMLFANPDRELRAGARLALYLGDQRVGDFVLQ